jgi:pantothenate kinase type III
MIFGFDIGNTNTTLGLYERESVSPVESYRFNTVRGMTADELALTVGGFIALHEKKNGNPVTAEGPCFRVS